MMASGERPRVASRTTEEQRPRPRIDGYAVLALAMTLLAWSALLAPTYFMGAHDAHHSLFFPLQFEAGLRAGDWLPRWGADIAHGYGYPIFVFYAPLTFYLWAGVHLTGVAGTVGSTKVLFALGFVLGAAGMYRYARSLWGSRVVALLAAVTFTLLPYRLLNVYVRAAFAEFMAIALLPWIALSFRRLIHRPTWGRAAWAAASYGALLWTHNITALTFTPLLGLLILVEWFSVWRAREESGRALWQRAWPVAGSIVLAVALGTAVWLPGLTEQAAIAIEQWSLQTYQYADHFVYPAQLVDPRWGFGYSTPGPGDGMSFQLGLVPLALAGLGVAGMLKHAQHPTERLWVIVWALALVVYVALMLPWARPLWDLGPFSTLIQFPWRLLAVAGLPLCLLAGFSARWLAPGVTLSPALVLAVLLVMLTTLPYTQPQPTPPNPRDETQQTWRDYEARYPDMVGMVAQTQVQPTESPLLPAFEANETPQRFQALDSEIQITQVEQVGSRAAALVVSEAPTTIRYLSYDYPGWQATVDGQPVAIRQEPPLGLMLVDVPAGEHRVELRFGDPPLRRAAEGVSLFSLAVLVGMAALGARHGGRA